MGLGNVTRDLPSEAACERCGNAYAKTFAVLPADGGPARRFDCFECAIDALAPTCAHCGIRVVGHGLEQGGRVFCCGSCARMEASRSRAATSNREPAPGRRPPRSRPRRARRWATRPTRASRASEQGRTHDTAGAKRRRWHVGRVVARSDRRPAPSPPQSCRWCPSPCRRGRCRRGCRPRPRRARRRSRTPGSR